MDRSDDNIDTEVDPQTVRTRPSSRPLHSPLPSQPASLPAGLVPAGLINGAVTDASAAVVPAVPSAIAPKPAAVFDMSAMARPVPQLPWPDVAQAPAPKLRVEELRTAPLGSKPAWPGLARKNARAAMLVFAGWLALTLALVVIYRFIDPPFSMLMLQQRITGQAVEQHWAPIEAISPNVVRAVLLSEDGRFCEHWGVDFDEMQNAIERAGDGIPRGASTISMQLTKNMFLWSSKSYVRKAIEIPLTFFIEALWPKRRIMEIYLNIAEWGPGIYGVEAASRYHFNKPAARLNEREAAQLAVALPNPILRDAGDPGPRTQRLAGDILSRMHNAPGSASRCVLGTKAAFRSVFRR